MFVSDWEKLMQERENCMNKAFLGGAGWCPVQTGRSCCRWDCRPGEDTGWGVDRQ